MGKVNIIILLTFLFIPNLYSEEISGDYIIQRLKQNEQKIQSLQADLSIEIKSAGMPQKMIQKGFFYYKAPDKTRMEINYPINQIMIKNGNKNYIKTFKSKRFKEVNQNANAGSSFELFLSGYMQQYHLEVDLTQSKVNENKYYVLGKKEDVVYIEFIFNKELGVIERYKIKGGGVGSSKEKTGLSMNIEVTQVFANIEGVSIPSKITAKVFTSQGTIVSIVKLENLKINGVINNSLFKAD